MRLLLALAVCLLLGCESTSEPIVEGPVCAEVGFFVKPEGELVTIYVEGPVDFVGSQGIILRPGECVRIIGIPE